MVTCDGGPARHPGRVMAGVHPADFGELKHVDGISPAWPVSYTEFEP